MTAPTVAGRVALAEALEAWRALPEEARADALTFMARERECWEDDGMWAPEALPLANQRHRSFGVVLDILRAAAVDPAGKNCGRCGEPTQRRSGYCTGCGLDHWEQTP